MIEPQNTMLPLAESAKVDTPQGEGEGFGEMLAQSLGMIPQVDPSAVQQIETGAHQGEESMGGSGEQSAPAEQQAPGVAASAVFASQPDVGQGTTNAAPNVDPPDLSDRERGSDGPTTAPSLGSTAPVRTVRYDRTDRGVVPLPTLPTRPISEPAPHVIRPIDTIWKPSPLGEPVAVDSTPIEGEGDLTVRPGGPIDSIWHPAPDSADETQTPVVSPSSDRAGSGRDVPVPSRAPGIDPPDIADQPDRNPGGMPDLGLEPVVAAAVDVRMSPVRRNGEPRLPQPPGPETPRPEVAAVAPQPVASRQPRVELPPEQPVRLDSSPVAQGSGVAEPGAPVAPEPTVADTSANVSAPIAAAGSSPGGASSMGAETLRPQASALADRVMQAIDLQRTQPPPRSMVVDIPELEGLRLLVSVRSAGNVTVAPASGSANPDAFAPLATDLSRVLAERGFVMNGDGRQRGHNPYSDDESAPTTPRRPSFRRPARVDDDLRM